MPSRQLPQPSTPDLARPLGGERPPRRLTRCYDRFTLALRRPVEPGQHSALDTPGAQPAMQPEAVVACFKTAGDAHWPAQLLLRLHPLARDQREQTLRVAALTPP